MSGWVYSGTLPSVEDRSRYTAPPDIIGDEDDDDEDVSPYDAGFAARMEGEPRNAPKYFHAMSREFWRKGWDAADEAEVERGEA